MALGAFSSAFSSAFDIGSQIVPDTHDGGGTDYVRREDIDRVRRRVRRMEEARTESIKQQREAGRQLVDALAAAYRRAVGEEPEIAEEMAAALAPAVSTTALRAPRSVDWRPVLANIDAVEAFLVVLDRDIRSRRAAEDEDIAILMLAVA